MDLFGKKILSNAKEIIIRAGLDWEVVESVYHEILSTVQAHLKNILKIIRKQLKTFLNVVFIIFATILCQF